jgi:hypothetical protein
MVDTNAFSTLLLSPSVSSSSDSQCSRDSLLTRSNTSSPPTRSMREWIKMADGASSADKKSHAQVRSEDVGAQESSSRSKTKDALRDQTASSAAARHDSDTRALQPHQQDAPQPHPTTEYRVYKRRWFGLFQLVLLNIIVSWDVCANLPMLT